MSTTRRPRWHPPPAPSPRIIHLPRRTRRKTTRQIVGKQLIGKEFENRRNHHRGKLEVLFDQERAFSRTVPVVLINSGECERRERVEELEFGESDGLKAEFEEEQWRFQAEILRAECNFLRMEREIALKKLELNRVQTKRTLRSAVHTLLSGKNKIYEGNNVGVALEEEIKDLEDKLMELQRCSGARDFEPRMCSKNFDKQALVLQRRLEKLGETLCEEKCVKEIREMAEASLTIKPRSCTLDEELIVDPENRCKDVEILRTKMERLSKGMLERMEEEYKSVLLSSSSSSASSSSRIEFHPPWSSAIVPQFHHQERMWREENNRGGCSGRCKSIVRKIVEQVRAETDEWSQMQEMLERVKEEMEELKASRDLWKNRALDSDEHVQSLQSSVQEWKERARASETKVSELEKQVSGLHIELGRLKTQKKAESARITSLQPMARESLKEKEKRVLICSLKENNHHSRGINGDTKNLERQGHCSHRCSRSKRASPLQDIGNLSPVLQKNSRALFALHLNEISHPREGAWNNETETYQQSM